MTRYNYWNQNKSNISKKKKNLFFVHVENSKSNIFKLTFFIILTGAMINNTTLWIKQQKDWRCFYFDSRDFQVFITSSPGWK